MPFIPNRRNLSTFDFLSFYQIKPDLSSTSHKPILDILLLLIK